MSIPFYLLLFFPRLQQLMPFIANFCLFLPFFSFFHFPAFISGFCSFRLFLFFFLFFCILAFSAIACFSTGFLDASSHLYKRVCPSVRPSICPLPLRKNRRGTHLIARPGLFLPLLVLNFFLDASLHLCKRVCDFVCASDRPTVRNSGISLKKGISA